MRTHQEMMAEINLREMLGLPRIELTEEERRRAFGDPSERDSDANDRMLAERLKAGLPMSKDGIRRAKQYLKSNQ